MAPFAAGQVLLGQTGEVHTVQFKHFIVEGFKDATHHTVLSRVNLNTDHIGLVGIHVTKIVDRDRLLIEGNTSLDGFEISFSQVSVEGHLVNLAFLKFRMGQFGGQITVVGQQ